MNNNGNRTSEETLNALVDRQFSPDEQAQTLQALDPDAAQRLCELRSLKEKVQLAYDEIPQPAKHIRKPPSRTALLAMAASVLLAVLLAAGIGLQDSPLPGNTERITLLDPRGTGRAPATADNGEMRVVFHVQDVVETTAAELLNEVEGLLRDFRLRGEAVRVEVVAHGEGLALLRSDLSGQGERIASMAEEWPQLAFVACLNTIDRLKNEQGIDVVLLPQAQTTLSGVAHVVRLQKLGWFYIQV